MRGVVHQNNIEEMSPIFNGVEITAQNIMLARSFLQCMQKGERSFGVASVGLFDKKLSTILNILGNLSINKSHKIAVVGRGLFDNNCAEYFELIEELDFKRSKELSINIYSSNKGIDFIDFEELKEVGVSASKLLKSYDSLFWEIPSLDEINRSPKSIYPYLVWLDRFSLVVDRESCPVEIDETISILSSLGVNTHSILD